MIPRSILFSASLFLAAVGSAQAEKLTLPVGEWGHLSAKGPDCKRPFLRIEQQRIVQRLDEGEARCVVKKIKKNVKSLFVDTKCDWDASVPQGLREGPDEDAPDSFSIKVLGPTKILFNNSDFGLCTTVDGAKP